MTLFAKDALKPVGRVEIRFRHQFKPSMPSKDEEVRPLAFLSI